MLNLEVSNGGPAFVPGLNSLTLTEVVREEGKFGWQTKLVFSKKLGEKNIPFFFNIPAIKMFDLENPKDLFKFKLKFNELAKTVGVEKYNSYQPESMGLNSDESFNEFFTKFSLNLFSDFIGNDFTVVLHYKKDSDRLIIPKPSENVKEGTYKEWCYPFSMKDTPFMSPNLNFTLDTQGESTPDNPVNLSTEIESDSVFEDPFA